MVVLHLKDGQEPPKRIHYKLGQLGPWEFSEFAEGAMAQVYSRRGARKSYIYLTDGYDNKLLETIYKDKAKEFPKEDHWVNVFGYITLHVVYRPSGNVRYARYQANETTLYKYVKKYYPGATWGRKGSPAWVRKR